MITRDAVQFCFPPATHLFESHLVNGRNASGQPRFNLRSKTFNGV